MSNVDKARVRESFSRSADCYDSVAVLQREIGQRMLDRLDYVQLQPKVILDAGAGTGFASEQLMSRYKKARVISMDFALPMLRHAAKRGRWLQRPACVCADIEQLPLASASVDLIYSNAAIQWCTDLRQTFAEFQRVLKPGGLLMFTTFGPDTLHELRAAWSQVDGTAHTSDFIDMHDIGDTLLHSRFADPVMDAERMQLTYESVRGLVDDLKTLGAHNASRQRQKGMTGKQRWQGMCAAYEAFRQQDRLPATYEVLYGHAWCPTDGRSQQYREGDAVHVPVDILKHQGGGA
jgi:malonyl-CoA O-methyltransferase